MPMPARSPNSANGGGQPGGCAILVLGMHRSGTSAVARVLNLCGASLGGELLPAKEDNERGFWENRAILQLHERFLAEAGTNWHDLGALPVDWQQSGAARRFVADLPRVLDAEFGDSALIAVKDPRLCLLAPLWIEVLQARGTRVACIMTIRDPDEIAASLARRDAFPAVQSHALWLQHLLDGEHATRGQARVFVHYERLLADWRAELKRIASTLRIDWPAASAGVDAEIDAFISPSLRHHRGSPNHASTAQPELVRRAYALACDAAAGSAVTDAAFDAIAGDFALAMQIAGPLYRELSGRMAAHEQQHAQQINEARRSHDIKDQQIEEARRSHDIKDRQIEEARANIDALANQVAQARDAHAARDQAETELRAEIERAHAEIERARAAFTLKEQEIEAARNNIAALARDIEAARNAIALKDGEIETARNNIATLARDIDSARQTIALKDREIETAGRNIDALARRIESLATELEEKEAQRAELRAALTDRDAEVDGARGNIDALAAEIGRAREAHGVRDATESALRAEIAALRQSRWFRLGRAIGLLDRGHR